MYFPFRVDLHSLKVEKDQQTNQTENKPKKKKNTNLGRKRKLPTEMIAIYEIASDFFFITLLCRTTYNMEILAPGSSNISFLNNEYSSLPLPTKKTDTFTEEHLREYVAREIYHTCIWDKNSSGPFCFIYNVSSFLKEKLKRERACMDPLVVNKIEHFINKTNPDSYTGVKSLFEFVDSHLTICARWYQMIQAFKLMDQMTDISDLLTFDAEIKRPHNSYQTSCSHHYAKIAKMKKSLCVRFLSWWFIVSVILRMNCSCKEPCKPPYNTSLDSNISSFNLDSKHIIQTILAD